MKPRGGRAGHCLEIEPIRTKVLQAQIDALEGYASNDAARKKRIVDAMKTNLERSFADAADRLVVRLERQVRDAIELHSDGRPAWLAAYIERVVYSGLPTAAAYAQFEADVLRAYRCPATGRYPAGLSRPC